MNTKEIAELKRTLSDKKETVRSVLGYYVNSEGTVIATFEKSCALMGEEEHGHYLSLFRRALSGGQNKNLFDIPFSTKDVTDGEAHKGLMALREGDGFDRAAADAMVAKISANYQSDDSYVVLFAKNRYDVLKRSKNGSDGEESESTEMFRFFVCVVCPVKTTKPELTYRPEEKVFSEFAGASAITAPEIGFLFPAFDNRQTNIYDALFYTKSLENAHEDLLRGAFGYEKPFLTAKAQDAAFRSALNASSDTGLSFEEAKALHQQIADRIEVHKESRDPEPLLMTKEQLAECMEASGISEESVKRFSDAISEDVGALTELSPKNLVQPNKFELKTPDVVIRVAAGKEDLVTETVVGGVPYLMVRADAGVELNGLPVRLGDPDFSSSGN